MPNSHHAAFTMLKVPPDFSGRVLISLVNGEVESELRLSDREHVATLNAFLEIALSAGYQVIPPALNGE